MKNKIFKILTAAIFSLIFFCSSVFAEESVDYYLSYNEASYEFEDQVYEDQIAYVSHYCVASNEIGEITGINYHYINDSTEIITDYDIENMSILSRSKYIHSSLVMRIEYNENGDPDKVQYVERGRVITQIVRYYENPGETISKEVIFVSYPLGNGGFSNLLPFKRSYFQNERIIYTEHYEYSPGRNNLVLVSIYNYDDEPCRIDCTPNLNSNCIGCSANCQERVNRFVYDNNGTLIYREDYQNGRLNRVVNFGPNGNVDLILDYDYYLRNYNRDTAPDQEVFTRRDVDEDTSFEELSRQIISGRYDSLVRYVDEYTDIDQLNEVRVPTTTVTEDGTQYQETTWDYFYNPHLNEF